MYKHSFATLLALTALALPQAAQADSAFDNWRTGLSTDSGSSAGSWSGKSSLGAPPTWSGGSGGGSSVTASYYWHPQRVASGGWFDPNALTAAHKTLPFGTKVRVTNASTGRSVDVVINDRGPYVAGREIDLSKAAAGAIGMQAQGVASVQMQVIGR